MQKPFFTLSRKPRSQLLSKLFVSIGVVISLGIIWWSDAFISDGHDLRVDATTTEANFNILDAGVHDASTPLEPISYYDSLSNRTYVVWSGGSLILNNSLRGIPSGHETSAMHVFIKYYDHHTKSWSSVQKVFEPPNHPEIYADGHYRQGVIVDDMGFVHVFQSYHITGNVKIRHAKSKQAQAINTWDVQNIPGTEGNTHGYFFKSRRGHIYGIYRKTFITGSIISKEYQSILKSVDNGKSFQLWDAIIPDHENLASGIKLHTAYITGYQYDPERDGVHLVFSLSARQKHYLKHYYVFFNFENDSFYGPDGTNMGKDIAISDHATLNTCCVIYDYGTPIEGGYDGKEVVIMLDDDAYPAIYFTVADRGTPSGHKTIRELIYDHNSKTWNQQKLDQFGYTHTVINGIYVNPDRKFLITLPVGNSTVNPIPGMAETHIYQWDGRTWSLVHNIKSDKFYSKQQTREFMLTSGFGRELTGFFTNLHDSIFTLPSWTIFGYYHGPIKTKLFGFRFNELLQSPMYNGDFQKENLSHWYVPNNDNKVFLERSGDNYFLKIEGLLDEPAVASPVVDFYEDLSGKSIKVGFRAKANADLLYNGLFLERTPDKLSGRHSDGRVFGQPFQLKNQWQSFMQTITFAQPELSNQTTKANVVLKPHATPNTSIYFDDFTFEYLGEASLPNCSGVEITSIAGTCTGSGYKASVSWNAVPGATEYYVAYDDDNQFWGDKPEIGEMVSGVFSTGTNASINFSTDKTRYFRVRIYKSSACTPQNWLYGSIKTITGPVCESEDINRDGVINMADYHMLKNNFTNYTIFQFNKLVHKLMKR